MLSEINSPTLRLCHGRLFYISKKPSFAFPLLAVEASFSASGCKPLNINLPSRDFGGRGLQQVRCYFNLPLFALGPGTRSELPGQSHAIEDAQKLYAPQYALLRLIRATYHHWRRGCSCQSCCQSDCSVNAFSSLESLLLLRAHLKHVKPILSFVKRRTKTLPKVLDQY